MKELILIFSLLLHSFTWAQDSTTEEEDPACTCTEEYDPVCSGAGVTYANSCKAACAGVAAYTPGICEDTTSSSTSTDDSTTTTSDSSSSSTTTSSSSLDDEGKITRSASDNPKQKVLMSTISLIAIGLLTPVFVKTCQKAPSAWIGGATAALYVANEIGLISTYKKGSNTKLEAYKNRSDLDKQIDSLEEAAGQSKSAAKAADTKAKFAKLAAMGFTMAAAVAIVESIPPLGPQACTGGPSATEPSSAPAADPKIEQLLQENTDAPFYGAYLQVHSNDLLISYNTSHSKSDLDAYFNFLEFINESGRNQSPSIDQYNALKKSNLLKFKGRLKETLTLVTSFFVPQANALDMMKIGALGMGSALTFLKPVMKVIEKPLKSAITNAFGRAAIFGAFAGVSMMAAGEDNQAASTFRDRANKYQELADELKAKSAEGEALKAATEVIDDTGLKMSCIQGSQLEIEVDETCACLASNTCKLSEIPNLSGLTTLDKLGSIQTNLKQLGDIANDLYKGNLDSASTGADSLLKNSDAMDALKDSLYDQVNKLRVEEGKSPYDFSKAESGLMSKLQDTITNGVNNLTDEQKAKLAALTKAKSLYQSGGLDAVLNNDSSSKDKAEASDFKFDFAFDQKDKQAVKDIVDDIDTAIDQNFSDVKNDINGSREQSIFKTLERAYQENAYPAFFEEDK